jgi:hypothetical protein
MTWTKIGGEFFDSPAILSVSRGARLLHVEAMTWCNRHGTDGLVPRHVQARITDEPDVDRAVKELIDAGLWTNDAAGWRIAGFLDIQPSAEDVERTQQRWRERWAAAEEHALVMMERAARAGDDLAIRAAANVAFHRDWFRATARACELVPAIAEHVNALAHDDRSRLQHRMRDDAAFNLPAPAEIRGIQPRL